MNKLDQARSMLHQYENFSNPQIAVENTNNIIELLEKYPDLMTDKQAIQDLSRLSASQVPVLASFLEKKISDVFQKGLEGTTTEIFKSYRENLKAPIKITLSGSKIYDKALKSLIGLPISELELIDCPNLTIKCLPMIGELSVKGLKLGSNDWVDDEVLANMPKNIETLSLATNKNFTGKGLAKLTFVLNLDLFGCNHLQDNDFTDLSNQFESLNLAMCRKLGDKTIHKLGTLPHLRHLTLTGNKNVTDKSLEMLPKDLLILNVSSCSLTDEAFKAISKMKKLQDLAIRNTEISGENLSSDLPLSIVKLQLGGCKKLTDAHITPLSSRKDLNYLDLEECPNISGDFKRAFDKTVTIDWVPPQESNWTRKVIREAYK